MRRWRLLWQLYPTYLLITALSLFVALACARHQLNQSAQDQAAKDLTTLALAVKSFLEHHPAPPDQPDDYADVCRELARTTSTHITLLDGEGRVLADTAAVRGPFILSENPEVQEALAGRIGIAHRPLADPRQEVMFAAVTATLATDILLPVPSSVVSTLAGSELGTALGDELVFVLRDRGLLFGVGHFDINSTMSNSLVFSCTVSSFHC
jgi:two-component system phosphate regulon sensor histidine kinase PhoR